MFSKRKYFAAAMIVAIGAALVAPVAIAGAATRGKGEASSSFSAFELEITHVPQVGNIAGSVGNIRLDATTLTAPVANVVVEAIRATGHSVEVFSASSNDPNSSESVSVPIEGPLTSGQISIAELLAVADADSATAALGALQSDLDIGPLGMSASSPRQGIKAASDPFGSSSVTGFSVGPFALSVGDLLPADLLQSLPLSVIFDLAKKLPVDVLSELRSTIRALRDVIDSVDAIETVTAQLDAAQAQLDALGVGSPAIEAAIAAVESAGAAVDSATDTVTSAQGELDAAQDAVDAAQAQLNTLTGQQTTLQNQLAACTVPAVCGALQAQLDALGPQITAAQAQLSAAKADRDAAQSVLDDAIAQLDAAEATLLQAVTELEALVGSAGTEITNLIDQLEGQLQALLDTLDETLNSIPNLDDLVSDVLFEIAGSPLFEIGKIQVMSIASSNAAGASSDVGCTISGASVLGEAIPGTNCDVVKQAWGEVEALIGGVFDALPVTGLPQISVAGLNTYEAASTQPDAQGFYSAAAGLRALQIAIPSIALADVVDQLVADATAQIEAILGTDIPDEALTSILDQVRAQLETLPMGSELSGLRTVGIKTSMAEVANQSRFRANNASIAPVPNPPGNNPPAANPPAPQPHAPMPSTGHELTYWAVMASVLLTVGAMVWHAGRRWENVMENAVPAHIKRSATASMIPAAAATPALSVAVAAGAARTLASPSKPRAKSSSTARPKAKSSVTKSAAKASKPTAKKTTAKSQATRTGTPAARTKTVPATRKAGAKRTAVKATAGQRAARKTMVRKTTVRRPSARKAASR